MTRLRTLLAVLLSDARRRPGAALASVLAIAVGAAVFTAIHLAGSGARSSFVSTVEALAGKATHEVSSQGGLAPERLASWITLPEVRAAQPIVEGTVAVVGIERDGDPVAGERSPLRLLGIDPLLATPFLSPGSDSRVVAGADFTPFLIEPGVVILPRLWAEEAGAVEGDTVIVSAAGRPVRLRVLSVYELDVLGEAAREAAVLDIATAQETLDRIDRIDRIELIVTASSQSRASDGDGGDEGDAPASLVAALEPGERLERPARRGERVARMIDAFRLNLLALGSLAVVVGALLVFNAAQFSVARRFALISKLRCLGATRGDILRAVILEVSAFGALGGLLGVLLGALLARWLAEPIAQTIRDLYAFVRVDVAPLDPLLALAVIGGATLVSALAAALPATDASLAPPRLAGVRSRGEELLRSRLPWLVAAALLSAALGVAAIGLERELWQTGLVAALLFLLAGACLTPPLLAAVLPPLRRVTERAGLLSLPLAAGALRRSLTRAGGAAAALGVALSMSIGVIVMVSSFDREVRRWIRSTLRADLFVADGAQRISGGVSRIPAEALASIRARPDVRAVDTLRAVEAPFGAGSLFFCGVEMSLPESWQRLEILSGEAEDPLAALRRGEAFVSEPLANHHDLAPGDHLEVIGRTGPTRFRVAAVFRDFSFDRGYAFVSSERYIATFGDTGARNAAVYLHDPTRAAESAAEIRRQFAGRFLLEVRSNAELRADVLEVFDRTFAVTYLLQVIATGMALCGIAVTLVALYLERGREIATLRAVGASAPRVARLFAAESLLMAAFPSLLALPLGALLAWILTDIVNLRAFGWTIAFSWPWKPVLVTLGLALAAGLLASALPISLLRRQSLAGALREE